MRNSQTFILIHGAWHASWCWARIATHLRERGQHVLTPDLPGHGFNKRPAKTVKFGDYSNCIMDLIKQQPEPVTLVGHSMAGLIISQIAEILPEHIRELVFIAGYIPKDKQSLLSIVEHSELPGVSSLLKIDSVKREMRLEPSRALASIFFNCCTEEDAQYAMNQLQPQPLQPFTEQISVGDNFNRVPKRSMVCQYDRALKLSDQLNMSHAVTDNILSLEADHCAYYSAENSIIKALLS